VSFQFRSVREGHLGEKTIHSHKIVFFIFISTRTHTHLAVHIMLYPPIFILVYKSSISFTPQFFSPPGHSVPDCLIRHENQSLLRCFPPLCFTHHSPRGVRVPTMFPLASNRLESLIRICNSLPNQISTIARHPDHHYSPIQCP
jgi:hypothetical protein